MATHNREAAAVMRTTNKYVNAPAVEFVKWNPRRKTAVTAKMAAKASASVKLSRLQRSVMAATDEDGRERLSPLY